MFKKLLSIGITTLLLFSNLTQSNADLTFNFTDFEFDTFANKEKDYISKKILSNNELNVTLTTTTSYLYTYSQSGHHFYGPAYDGSYIDTYGCCSGQSGSCRNNPSCQCQVSVGPLPQGTYTLGNMMTFKGMPYCYELYPASTNNMCGRSGFLIHGGDCSSNPSEGCIVIQDQNTRYKIKSGATLKVVS